MDGIAQRIENRGVFLWDGGIKLPDVRLRNDHVLGEGAIGIYADDLHVLADVSFAGAALQALAAGHVHLGGNEVAFLDAGDFIAECGHLAAELMPWNQRRMNAVLRPAIPVVDVQVGAADGCDLHLDQNVGPAESWDLYLANFRAGCGFWLYHSEHRGGHEGYLMNSDSDTKRMILAL